MPLYEYRCEACGDIFEVKQRISEEPLTVHEKCGGRLERLISPPALQFKGSGWYITDYARASSKSESGKGKESKDGGGSKESSKAETATKKSDT